MHAYPEPIIPTFIYSPWFTISHHSFSMVHYFSPCCVYLSYDTCYKCIL